VYRAVVGALPVPLRSGYTFAGWNTADDGSGAPYSEQTTYETAGSVTVYAQWTEGNPTAVEPLSVASLKIYPNPTTGVVTVENGGAEVQVYSLSGILLQQTRESRIDLSGYAAGVYLLRAGDKTAKVVLISERPAQR
jgi:uncharacterized repeat protein (TIGR02543 family)